MAQYNRDWDDLGRSVQDVIDRAVHSQDYQKLNQTVRQAVGRAVDMGSEAVRRTMSSTARPQPRTVAPEKKPLPALYGSTGRLTAGGVLKTVGGGVLSLFSLTGGLFAAAWDMLFYGIFQLSVPLVLSLIGFGGGALLVGSGVRTLGLVNRFRTYRRTLGEQTHCTLERLARSVGKSVGYVRKELQQMISKGLFLEGHLDHEQASLITSDETYRHYEQCRLQMEQAKQRETQRSQNPQVQEVLDRGNAFLEKLRRCNEAIPGEEISEKISHMELIVERIFDRAEEHPEIVPDLKKLMDYYLPMTVKLLNAYADMDAQPVQGDTILAAKREIEGTLDTLNVAFEKLLDSVFEDTAMDISSDISVLNTLLAQEGLTDDELTKLKKQS